jgi:putative inorganic carbon (hco3(-)) transporter
MVNPLIYVRQLSGQALEVAAQHRQRLMTIGGLIAIGAIATLYGLLLSTGISMIYLLIVPIGLIGLWMVFMLPDYATMALFAFRWGFIFDSLDSSVGIQSPALPLTILLLIVLAVQSSRRQRAFVNDPILWVLLAYFLHVSFGVWYATYPNLVTDRMNDFSKDIFYTIVIMNFLINPRVIENTIYLTVACGALLGFLTIFQEVTQTYDNTYWDLAKVKIAFIVEGVEDRPRASGPLGDPNFYGQQLLVLVPLGLWWVIHARNLLMRLIAIACLAMVAAGVGLSYSRGALLAIAVMFAFYFVYFRVQFKYLAYLVPMFVVAFIVAPPELKDRFSTLTQFFQTEESGQVLDNSFEERSRYLVVGRNMILDSPLIGLGADHFKANFTTYILELGQSPDRDTNRNAHNYYLEVTTEHGLIGLALVSTMLIMSVRRFHGARKDFHKAGDARMSDLSGFLLVALIGYMFSAISLHGDFPRFLWMSIGLAAAVGFAGREALAQHQHTQNTGTVSETMPRPAQSEA